MRLEESRSMHTGGTGLGPAIVRQIAQPHQQDLSLHGRPGGDTVARLALNLKAAIEKPPST